SEDVRHLVFAAALQPGLLSGATRVLQVTGPALAGTGRTLPVPVSFVAVLVGGGAIAAVVDHRALLELAERRADHRGAVEEALAGIAPKEPLVPASPDPLIVVDLY